MFQEEMVAAIESLERLENYYQNKYERYLAEAMAAKAHREKIAMLLRDLEEKLEDVLEESHESEFTHEIISTSIAEPSLSRRRRRKSFDLPEAELERTNGYGSQLRATNLGSETEVSRLESNSEGKIDTIASFLKLSKIVLPAIKKVFDSEPNKTLHLSYLQKILNSELNLDLTEESLELYLNQAIDRGYCRLDTYDRNCYTTTESQQGASVETSPVFSNDADSGEAKAAGDLADDSVEQTSSNKSGMRKLHNLPESNKLKVTLLETIRGFLKECKPKVFSTREIIDYLYSERQQSNWTTTRRTKIRQSIANVLGRRDYLGREWVRVKPGIYRPKK